ncbi:MAG: hypothetical protein Q9163_002189 [Psora crenata]
MSIARLDLRQCLIYDSSAKDARLIGVEFMVPKHIYLTFPEEEQKLWHSHEYEVKSGMLVLPKPAGMEHKAWEEAELKAMEEVIGLYGKTWHFWQIDRGDEIPFGFPKLMGSLTCAEQLGINQALRDRNHRHKVDHTAKAHARQHIQGPGIHELVLKAQIIGGRSQPLISLRKLWLWEGSVRGFSDGK